MCVCVCVNMTLIYYSSSLCRSSCACEQPIDSCTILCYRFCRLREFWSSFSCAASPSSAADRLIEHWLLGRVFETGTGTGTGTEVADFGSDMSGWSLRIDDTCDCCAFLSQNLAFLSEFLDLIIFYYAFLCVFALGLFLVLLVIFDHRSLITDLRSFADYLLLLLPKRINK